MWESAGEPNWDDATKAGGACTAEDAKGQTPEVTENTPVYEPEQTPAEEAMQTPAANGSEQPASESGGCSATGDDEPSLMALFLMLVLGYRRLTSVGECDSRKRR